MTAVIPTRLPTLAKRCLYHVVSVLHGSCSAPDQQAALVARFTAFCVEVGSACGYVSPEGLVQQSDLQRFADGWIAVKEFCDLLERALIRSYNIPFNVEALQDACFRFCRIAETSSAETDGVGIERLSPFCLYRLWLVFNVLTGKDDSVLVQKGNFRDLLKRFFELSGLKWANDPDEIRNKDCLTFSECLHVIRKFFEKQDLRMPLTCEMIEDVYDEFVCGVHMKGYLVKLGHVRKNLKRRWFVLRRTELTYFQSKDTLLKKGQIFLGSETQVKDTFDTKKLKNAFEICCFVSGKPFLLVADTQKSKHQWMTTIKKVLVLTKLTDQKGNEELYGQSLQHFYTLKYGSTSFSPRVADPELKMLDHYKGFSDLHDSEDQQSPTIEVPSPATHPTGSSSHDTFGVAIPAPPAMSIPVPPVLTPSTVNESEQLVTEQGSAKDLIFDENDYALPTLLSQYK